MKKEPKKPSKMTGIRTKISLMMIVLLAVVVLTLTLTLFFSFRKTTAGYILDALETTMEINGDSVEELMERIRTADELVYPMERVEENNLPPIAGIIVRFDPKKDYSDLNSHLAVYQEGRKLFQDYFQTCFGEENFGAVSQLYVEDTYPLAAYLSKIYDLDQKESGFFSARKVKTQDWYQKTILQDGENYWFTRTEEPDRIYVSRLLKISRYADGSLMEYPLGVLVLQLDVSWISSRIQMDHMTQNTQVFLTDVSGNTVYASPGALDHFSDRELERSDETIHNCTYQGISCLIQKRNLALGLNLVTMVPISEVHFLALDAFRIILYVAGIVLIFAILLSMLVSGKIVRPIEELSRHMKRGSTEMIGESASSAEIDVLYRSFNELMQKLKQADLELAEAFEKEKEANLRALQAQINPHFIYNTLNSVSCMALLHQENEISQVLGSLTKVIRYNLKKPDAIVHLEEELENIYSWCRIQECCYEQSIRFSYDIQVPADQIKIPKLIIQPLIENAVVHGANFAGEDARICLHIWMEGKCLYIVVWDNGTDVDTDRINRLACGKGEVCSDSLGVRNVYERIRLRYGSAGQMRFEQDEEHHTLVQIVIPAEMDQSL